MKIIKMPVCIPINLDLCNWELGALIVYFSFMDMGTGGHRGHALTFQKFIYKVSLSRSHSCPFLHLRVPPEY